MPTPLFENFPRGHVWTVPGVVLVKFEVSRGLSLAVFEQLAFNAQKFRGHVPLATPTFEYFPRGHVRTVPVDVLVKFEVRIFNRFRAIGRNTAAMCAQTDRQTKVKT